MIKNPVFIKTNPDHIYQGEIAHWVDGDTVDVDLYIFLDFGFHWYETKQTKQRIRLMGINTPEKGQSNYKEATAFMESHAPVGMEVLVQTYKMPTSYASEEKYGRYLADVFVQDLNLNKTILASGLAVAYFGGTK
jgi:micrococcal nuclease